MCKLKLLYERMTVFLSCMLLLLLPLLLSLLLAI